MAKTKIRSIDQIDVTTVSPLDSKNGFRDANGNIVLEFASTGSAVNDVRVANAATGSGPTISAVGTDTNIDLNLNPKGTGVLQSSGIGMTLTSAVSNRPLLSVKNTNADANGSFIQIMKDGGSPADNDVLGHLEYAGKDDAGNEQIYARLSALSLDVSNGAERGGLQIGVAGENGTVTAGLELVGLASSADVDVDVKTHDGGTSGLKLAGTLVTAVAGEINALDLGATAVGTAIASKAVILDSDKDYTGVRHFTLTGELDAGSLDISGDADIDGTLEADAITVNGATLQVVVEDHVGAMLDGTETGIAVSYDSTDNNLDFVISAAQTTITSILATDIKIGEDDQTKIDFEDADKINFYAGNEKQLILEDGALYPGSDNIIDLGKSGVEFKDAFFDGTVEADAITVGGTDILTGSIVTSLGTVSQDTILFTSANSADPLLQVKNTNADASGARFQLIKDSASPADDDEVGKIEFIGDDAGGNATTYGSIIAESASVTAGSEAGKLKFGLASTDDGGVDVVAQITAGAAAASSTFKIFGNLEVAGTTTQVNTVTMEAANAVVFEGATADLHETTLTITDPTADRTITLPNMTGHVPLLAGVLGTGTAVITAGEFNLLDGGSTVGTTAIGAGDGFLHNDAGTMRQTNVDTLDTYYSQTTKTLTNKTLTAPVLNSATVGTVLEPTSDNGAALGSANKNWSDLYLADEANIYFGDDQDIVMTHVTDSGLKIHQGADAAGEPLVVLEAIGDLATGPILKFNLDNGAGEADGDVIGELQFFADDSDSNNQQFAGIKALQQDVTSGSESGKVEFNVAELDGTLSTAMTISGSDLYDGGTFVDIAHNGVNYGLKLGGQTVVSNATELNLLAGKSSLASDNHEFNEFKVNDDVAGTGVDNILFRFSDAASAKDGDAQVRAYLNGLRLRLYEYQVGSYAGTAVGADSTTVVQLSTDAINANDAYNGMFIYIYEGTGNGQIRLIDDYVAATDKITVGSAFSPQLDNTSKYIISGVTAAADTHDGHVIVDSAQSGSAKLEILLSEPIGVTDVLCADYRSVEL
tara:strand:- start:117 stop:3263 length:3147 start_codon:yes stop_codon:yes gene_type:complete